MLLRDVDAFYKSSEVVLKKLFPASFHIKQWNSKFWSWIQLSLAKRTNRFRIFRCRSQCRTNQHLERIHTFLIDRFTCFCKAKSTQLSVAGWRIYDFVLQTNHFHVKILIFDISFKICMKAIKIHGCQILLFIRVTKAFTCSAYFPMICFRVHDCSNEFTNFVVLCLVVHQFKFYEKKKSGHKQHDEIYDIKSEANTTTGMDISPGTLNNVLFFAELWGLYNTHPHNNRNVFMNVFVISMYDECVRLCISDRVVRC